MNRHARPEPPETHQLVVPIDDTCFSRAVLTPDGVPRLIVDYGGAALVLDTADPVHAETFALGLARCSLAFASHCRYLIDEARKWPTTFDNTEPTT